MNTEDTFDTIETLLAMALSSEGNKVFSEHTWRLADGSIKELVDQGECLKFDEMYPSMFYTADHSDDDRLFSLNFDELVAHPSEIFGSACEIALFNDAIGVYKWFGYRRVKKPKLPHGVAVLGKADMFYEAHIRFTTIHGVSDYAKRVIPLDKTGRPLPCMFQKRNALCGMTERDTFIINASIVEDAHRANTILATVQDGVGLKLPIPVGEHKELFSVREGPLTRSGKRKAILHWVAKHMRTSSKGEKHIVDSHTRGVREFECEGFRIKLEPNAVHHTTYKEAA